jgi:hypothetical protein
MSYQIECLDHELRASRAEISLPQGTAVMDIVANEIAKNRDTPAHGRLWTLYFTGLAFVIYAMSAKSYRFISQLFVLPSVSTTYQQVGPRLKFMGDCLASLQKIPQIVTAWRRSRSIDADQSIDAVLGCDAAAFKESEIDGKRCKNCFAFLVMPIDPNIPCFPIPADH